MSRKRYRSKPALALPASRQVQASNVATGYLLSPGGFQAAGESPSRGYIYWPTTDTRRQMTTLTRTEILRRIQWLYEHFGFCRRIVHGMARLLGYLIPQPNTSDEEWNDLAYNALTSIFGNAEIWDVQGKFDGFIGQVQDNVSAFRDGDCLAVFTETPSGRARMAYYESHQIKNGPDTSGPGWVDGVLVSRQGKHLAYSVQDGEDPTKFTVVQARDALYIGNFTNRGQVRAISILSTAVLNMIDVVETRGFTKTAIKNHSRMGSVIERDSVAPASSAVGGFGGIPTTQTVIMPDGSTQTLNMEIVYQGSTAQTLPPGHKLKLITNDTPSPNNMEFEKALLTDCAYAADLSYNTLCDVSGITGPGIRFLNAELKRWIALRRYPQAKRMSRFAVYALAKEMKRGALRLPMLKEGEQWWSEMEWIGLADMDIDGGRTAAATVTDLQSGQTTWLDQWGSKGAFWKRRIRQAIHEVVFAELECAAQAQAAGLEPGRITVERVFPARFGVTSAQPSDQITDPNQIQPAAVAADPGDTPDPIDEA